VGLEYNTKGVLCFTAIYLPGFVLSTLHNHVASMASGIIFESADAEETDCEVIGIFVDAGSTASEAKDLADVSTSTSRTKTMDFATLSASAGIVRSFACMTFEAQDGSPHNAGITKYLMTMLLIAERHRTCRMRSLEGLERTTRLSKFLTNAMNVGSPGRGNAILELFQRNEDLFAELGGVLRAAAPLASIRRCLRRIAVNSAAR